jgi:transposase-like protein
VAAQRARSDVDRLREMIGYVAQRLMSLEVESLCGAGHGKRTPERTNQRDGYRDRSRAPLSMGHPRRHDRARIASQGVV